MRGCLQARPIGLRSGVRGCLVARGRMDGARGRGQGPGFEGETGPLWAGVLLRWFVGERASPREQTSIGKWKAQASLTSVYPLGRHESLNPSSEAGAHGEQPSARFGGTLSPLSNNNNLPTTAS
jgi:hypothetical protein